MVTDSVTSGLRSTARRATSTAAVVMLGALAGCSNAGPVEVRSAAPIPPESDIGRETVTATVPPVDTTPSSTSPSTSAPTTDIPTATAAEDSTTTTSVAEEPTLPTIAEAELLAMIPLDEVVDVGDAKPARAHDGFVAVAFTDIERWWTETFPTVYGVEFEPLSGGIYAGYPERTAPIPGCSERETRYDDLKLYVAFYCNVGDFMAYDDGADPDPLTGSLLTPLADQFGPAVVGVVLAHEYGHVIQDRIGALDQPLATIVTEQQADCFAGAWTGQAYRGESPLLRLGDTDVRAGLLAMLEVRDPVGTSQFVAGGHGSAFDRVGAFQVGFVDGAARCAELIDEPLPLMPNEFQPLSPDEFFGGNAPYDCDLLDPTVVSAEYIAACTDAPVFLADDLNNFWEVTFEGEWEPFTVVASATFEPQVCNDAVVLTGQVIVCPTERRVVYDEPAVIQLYDEFGDFTLGYLYGIAAAELAQPRLETSLTGERRALLNDCLAGAWVRDITPDAAGQTPRNADLDGDGEAESTVASSPGDLDEAIRMAILVGDLGANVDVVGSAFEKIDAFRTGVLGGLAACDVE